MKVLTKLTIKKGNLKIYFDNKNILTHTAGYFILKNNRNIKMSGSICIYNI